MFSSTIKDGWLYIFNQTYLIKFYQIIGCQVLKFLAYLCGFFT